MKWVTHQRGKVVLKSRVMWTKEVKVDVQMRVKAEIPCLVFFCNKQ